MTTSPVSVSCIGLGRIGSGMAHCIQARGFRLTVYNRTTEKTQPFLVGGATVARTPREAAAGADVVVTCLMDDASVLDNTLGKDGILASLRRTIHIGTSTISPSASVQLSGLHDAHGSHYIAGPIAGRPEQAAAGKLLTFVAGKPDIIDRCRPILDAYAARVMVLGADPAAAASMKLAVNFFAACLLELIGETFVFAEKRGLDVAAVSELYKDLLRHPAMPVYLDKIRTRNFDQDLGFTLEGAMKDIRLILDAAAEVQTPLPYASLVRDKCITALSRGMGQRDWSSFTTVSRLNAGLGE
jgi:3-hydroxyisobutyrate dehydrogenase-like beta-hydroxyacid dehydrogenase